MTTLETGADVLADVWALSGEPEGALDRVSIVGDDPVLPSVFRVARAASVAAAASGLAVSELWRSRTGRGQTVTVDARSAALAFRAERYLQIDGSSPGTSWDPLAGYYRTADGWIQLHTNFPLHRRAVVDALGCDATRDAVAAELAGRRAVEVETAVDELGGCSGALRSTGEWRSSSQSKALDDLPLFEIERIGDAAPEPLAPGERPLDGVRVLDLTRVIAGPVCGRELASHGATVMRVAGPHLPSLERLVIESGRGKLSAHVDLRDGAGRETLRELLRDADVFVQGYRPGAIARCDFSPERVAEERPGILYVSLSAFGRRGPWSGRRGFDSLVQTVSGIADAGRRAAPGWPSSGTDRPRPLPCQALDYASGFLLAFGTVVGLLRRAREGGSWHVRVSLAQTGRWIENLGRIDALDCPDPGIDDVRDRMETMSSPFGAVSTVKSPVELSETPPHWRLPPVPLGTHPPVWPPA